MNITVHTDGACRGNQFDKNLGAWAYHIEGAMNMGYFTHGTAKAVENTTNNRMELTAVIKALEWFIAQPSSLAFQNYAKITVYSDSTYVIMGINAWSKGWEKKNWKDVKNVDLWKQLIDLKNKFNDISFRHIAGHSGNKLNDLVDSMCNEAMDNFENQQKRN